MKRTIQDILMELLTEEGRANFAALEPEEKKKSLLSRNYANETVLMLAIMSCPDAVEPILESLQTLDAKSQADILSALDDNAYNALTLAAKYQPESVGLIIDALERISVEAKTNILKNVNKRGRNALLWSLEVQSPYEVTRDVSVPLLIFNAMENIDPADKKEILGATETFFLPEGPITPLMQATRSQPEAVLPMINVIKTINDPDFTREQLTLDVLEKFLRNHDSEHFSSILDAYQELLGDDALLAMLQRPLTDTKSPNLLMLAAYNRSPKAVVAILAKVQSLNNEDALIKILSSLTVTQKNALMEAVEYQPESIGVIFEAIYSIQDSNARQQILLQVDRRGENVFQVAKRGYNPTSLPIFLASCIKHKDNTFFKEGWNPLMYAAYERPKGLNAVLQAIEALDDPNDRIALFTQRTIPGRRGWNALMLCTYHPEHLGIMLTGLYNTFKHVQPEDLHNYDELFESMYIYPEILYNTMQSLPESWKSVLFNECLNQNTLLGRYMAQKNAVKELDKMREHLANPQPMASKKDRTIRFVPFAKEDITAQKKERALERLSQVLQSLAKSDSEMTINELLEATHEDGLNALMIAAKYQPQSMPVIISAMRDLDEESKTRILMQTDAEGKHALLMALSNPIAPTTPIVEAIRQLSDTENQKRIIKHRDNKGCDALKFSALFAPEHLANMMEAMLEFAGEDDLQASILFEDKHWGGALLAACDLHYSRVAVLVRNIKAHAGEETLKQALTQSKDNQNALMRALSWNVKAAEIIIENIESLNDQSLTAQILIRPNNDSMNALMIAADRGNVALILPAIMAIKRQNMFFTVFRHRNFKNENAFDIAAKSKDLGDLGLLLKACTDATRKLSSSSSDIYRDYFGVSTTITPKLIFDALQTLPEEQKLEVYRECLRDDSLLLGRFFADHDTQHVVRDSMLRELPEVEDTSFASGNEDGIALEEVPSSSRSLSTALKTHAASDHIADLLTALMALDSKEQDVSELQENLLDYLALDENQEIPADVLTNIKQEMRKYQDVLVTRISAAQDSRPASPATGGLFSTPNLMQAWKAFEEKEEQLASSVPRKDI